MRVCTCVCSTVYMRVFVCACVHACACACVRVFVCNVDFSSFTNHSVFRPVIDAMTGVTSDMSSVVR